MSVVAEYIVSEEEFEELPEIKKGTNVAHNFWPIQKGVNELLQRDLRTNIRLDDIRDLTWLDVRQMSGVSRVIATRFRQQLGSIFNTPIFPIHQAPPQPGNIPHPS